jgi:L-ascorbate peroxidase
MSTVAAASDAAQLKSAREDIKELLKSKFCHPILVILFYYLF